MPSRKTKFFLWVVMSLLAFIALGLLVRVVGLGERSYYEEVSLWASDLRSGHGGSGALGFVALLVGVWLGFAAILGWLFEQVVVILISRHHETR
jgi:hypothetical protein